MHEPNRLNDFSLSRDCTYICYLLAPPMIPTSDDPGLQDLGCCHQLVATLRSWVQQCPN